MHDTWYSVYVEAQAPPGAQISEYEAAADELMDLLAGHSGVVADDDTSWSATVSVHAGGVRSAAAEGAQLIERLASKAGMPAWPLARCEAVRQDVLEGDNAHPTLPEIVSVPEAADILGVSQQRTRELAATQQDFPEPVYDLKTGKLWLRAAIEAYAARRPRKPGRPGRHAKDQGLMLDAAVTEPADDHLACLATVLKFHLRTDAYWDTWSAKATARVLNVYLVAEDAGTPSRSWRAWKAHLQRWDDVTAGEPLDWTDAEEEELREILGGAHHRGE